MALLRILLLLLLAACFGLIGAWYWLAVRPLDMHAEHVEFRIPSGAGLRSSAQIIEDAGVGLPAWQLAWLGRLLDRSRGIKAGSYEIKPGLTAVALLDVLTRGDVTRTEIALVEGRSFRQFRQLLDQHPDLRHDTTGLTDEAVMQRLGASALHPEGQFFPDTYLADKGSSDIEVLRRAHRAMQARLDATWAVRDPGLPLKSAYELLILASIVEKETGTAADRGLVASVFVNRLRIGMPLQTDPTVIYGLGERFDGNLRKIDLQTDTPWNTYTRGGLPPTPIAMPGLAALMAVAQAPKSNYLYFVARGDGSSQFSTNLDDHNRAVNRYQRGGRS